MSAESQPMVNGESCMVNPLSTIHHPPPQACQRADLSKWAVRGGPLPIRLAAHAAGCLGCAEHIRRVNRVHASLTLLRTRSGPPDLLARANGRALRMIRRAARACPAAQRLARMHPGLSAWQRTRIHIARLSWPAAAAVLLLIVRAGMLVGFQQTRQLGTQLTASHWDRHIDPTGEFLGPGPRDLT